MKFTPSKQVKEAINNKTPVLALESTIISSGMPYPKNIEFYNKASDICLSLGVVPATIAIIRGEICVGLEQKQVEHIATDESVIKVPKSEIGVCMLKGLSGATTVSSTAHISHQIGIKVFATGGIGGVHRGYSNTLDMSQDLNTIKNTPLVVVCSGVKSFLDVEKTVEALETLGVTTLGFKTDSFPLFYSSYSKIRLQHRVNSFEEIIGIYKNNLETGLLSSVLVLNPIPEKNQIPNSEINKIIDESIVDLTKNKITGKQATPYLLKKIAKQTNNRSLDANISLATNNIKLGAKIAKELNGLPH
tara:strand:+ start:568 stop:1479 length:912 start_codon:yes stop_codon:yes gene_type:complete